jgi:hypothetical protein
LLRYGRRQKCLLKAKIKGGKMEELVLKKEEVADLSVGGGCGMAACGNAICGVN